MILKHLVQSLERTEKEIREERANALSLSGEKMDRLIAQLQALRSQIDALPEAQRAPHIESYRELHKQARYQFWCFVVQREALGLYQHCDLEQLYVIPPEWK